MDDERKRFEEMRAAAEQARLTPEQIAEFHVKASREYRLRAVWGWLMRMVSAPRA